MFYLLLLFISFSLILLLKLAVSAPSDYIAVRSVDALRRTNSFTKNLLNIYKNLGRFLDDKFDFLANVIGAGSFIKLFLPSVSITLFCCFVAGPLLTNATLGPLLGILISLAYISRIFFCYAGKFREKLLSQLERILITIRGNLSTGMTLDYAVNEAMQYNLDLPLGPHLANFVKLSETNFIENFPGWLLSVQKSFKLKELAKSAQLLSLELTHTSNQEQAFMNAAISVADRSMSNKKQKNILNITFFTLDFMSLCFLGLLFFIIPGLSSGLEQNIDWWHSSGRPVTVCQSAAVIWGAYLGTVSIALWRQS